MDKFGAQIDQWKSQLPGHLEKAQEYLDHVKSSVPTNYEQLQPHIEYFKSITSEDIISDFSEYKITPITVSITVTALTTILIVSKLLSSLSGSSKSDKGTKKKSKKPKKKISKAQKANKDIQSILDFVESEYVPQIDEYIAEYKSLKPEEVQYKYKYFEEMLLKELMKLDEVDVSGNEILRDNRKKVIKFVQDHQKRLDKFKKDKKF
ncbi:BAG domain-containing protein [Scheffersomyces xylosifermentans]|uniref:BAG domain-containing protein n=1 Tax=Scheffersomyces xylosifermentans TaxID=1304137 RepID=UPI00315D808E